MMTEEFFPLHPSDSGNVGDAPAGIPMAPQQQVMLQGRILFERTAFVGHSFSDADEEVISFVKAVLSEMAVKSISGERAEARSVSDKVKSLIAQADLFVGILTRREPIGEGQYRTSEWLIEEKIHAAATGKKVIVLKEAGVVATGGLLGDAEYVEFDRTCLHKCAPKIMQMIWSLNPGKVAFNKSQPPHLNVSVLESAVAAQPNEPMLRVELAKVRVASGQADAALRDLGEALRRFPEFVPARLELIKGLRSMGRTAEAEAETMKLLSAHPHSGRAHHHLAHILETKKKFKEAAAEFAVAQDCEPSDPSNYRCCGQMLFRIAGDNRSKLLEAKELLQTAVEIGGPVEQKLCTPFLAGIHRKLKGQRPSRSQEKKRRKK